MAKQEEKRPLSPARAAWENFLQRTPAQDAFEKGMWERYGHGDLSPGTMQGAFEQAVRPEQLGFTRSRPGWYARPVGDRKDMFHVLRYFVSKSWFGVFMWGVSLTFVPHGWLGGGQPRWHRTLRSVQMDHGEYVGHHVLLGGIPPAPHYLLSPRPSWGDEAYYEHVAQAWDLLRPIALRWYETVTDVATIVDRIDRIAVALNEPAGPDTTHAFCLARLGRMAEARAELDALISAWGVDSEPIHAALEKIAEGRA